MDFFDENEWELIRILGNLGDIDDGYNMI